MIKKQRSIKWSLPLPKFEHSIVLVVQIVREGGGLYVQLADHVELLAGLVEPQFALGGIVGRPPGLPRLAEAGGGGSQHTHRACRGTKLNFIQCLDTPPT